MLSLSENEAHLWWAYPDRIRDPELLERQFTTLSSAEQQQQRRFVFERHRRQYLVSHALIRDVLSHYSPVSPDQWRFEVNEYGRPYIAEPAEWNHLQFNLSHTEGRAVVVVAREIEVGVDVECTSSQRDTEGIVEQYFSPVEIAQLRERPDSFLDFWTLKESYIKARGMGLAIPLESFSFVLSGESPPRIVFHDGCHDHADRWQFTLRRGEDYCVALAAATGTAASLHIVEREVVPLADKASGH